MNAVVDINTVVSTANGNGSAAGTGLILNSHGEVLTNNHVVAGATSITVNLVGGTVVYNASVVGVDPTDDIAVIQVSGVKNWPSASFADTTSLSVGAKVSAVGNALGLGGPPRVSTGKITAVGQSITAGGLFDGTETLSNMIEFDATVSPGESGGPLLDSNGKVVGMITAASGGNGNLPSAPAYAIPSNTALSIVRQVEAGHASSTIILGQVGYIGVVVSELDAASATQVNLSVGQGVLVISVNADSPAQKAGLTAGSVIEAVGNQKVSTRVELGTAIHAYKPGDSLSVTWADKQGTHTASLVLIGGPAI
jgi:S1-C subfamily serine protease